VVLTPAQVRHAYGFDIASFKNGTVAANGNGQTIAIIDAYGDSKIASDLATFDKTFGLATANLTVVNQTGGTALPANNANWATETALDVEWAHAIAPGAKILLVEAKSANLSDLLGAVDYARHAAGVSVVSMSWGGSEFQGENSYDTYFTTPAGHTGVTFVGSSGDNGAPSLWPALSPNVLAVGGTTLSFSSAGNYLGETAWSGSGGSPSKYESEPSYQHGFQSTGARTAPDVSYDANPNTGFYVYSTASGGAGGWYQVGGTSAGAPQWGALIAIANQGRALNGLAALNGVQAQIYALPSADFHDITSGSNGYKATAGYDLVTGRGSPIANLVIAGLVNSTASGAAAQTAAFVGPVQKTFGKNAESVGGDGSDGTNLDVAVWQVAQQSSSTPANSFTSVSTILTTAAPSQFQTLGLGSNFGLSSAATSLSLSHGLTSGDGSSIEITQSVPDAALQSHAADTSLDSVAVAAAAAQRAMDSPVQRAELSLATLDAVWSVSDAEFGLIDTDDLSLPAVLEGPAGQPAADEMSPLAVAFSLLGLGSVYQFSADRTKVEPAGINSGARRQSRTVERIGG
jgi:subtilase family serine protease